MAAKPSKGEKKTSTKIMTRSRSSRPAGTSQLKKRVDSLEQKVETLKTGLEEVVSLLEELTNQ